MNVGLGVPDERAIARTGPLPFDEDVLYLIKGCTGENTPMIGTDYGHAHSSIELEVGDSEKQRRDHRCAARNIVEENPWMFYGLV